MLLEKFHLLLQDCSDILFKKGSLTVYYFHGIFKEEKEAALQKVDPQWVVTIQGLRQFIDSYLEHDYSFVSPIDVLNGLTGDKKYILMTFDDGYFNNLYALPILNEFDIPAVFFIISDYIKNQRPFWLDIVYRERKRQRVSLKKILCEQRSLLRKTHTEIDAYVRDSFGEKAMKIICDIDRHFTAAELRSISKEKNVYLGNHTSDHANLTCYHSSDIISQIRDAQDAIKEIAGITPVSISYPYGGYSGEVIKIAQEMGLKLGFTTWPQRASLPMRSQTGELMRLGRFEYRRAVSSS